MGMRKTTQSVNWVQILVILNDMRLIVISIGK